MMGASSVGRDAALADALTVGNVMVAGLDENGWRITGVRVAEFHEIEHEEINGLVMFERLTFPIPGKGWGIARWELDRGGVQFFTGEYDLTREEAVADFNKRGLD